MMAEVDMLLWLVADVTHPKTEAINSWPSIWTTNKQPRRTAGGGTPHFIAAVHSWRWHQHLSGSHRKKKSVFRATPFWCRKNRQYLFLEKHTHTCVRVTFAKRYLRKGEFHVAPVRVILSNSMYLYSCFETVTLKVVLNTRDDNSSVQLTRFEIRYSLPQSHIMGTHLLCMCGGGERNWLFIIFKTKWTSLFLQQGLAWVYPFPTSSQTKRFCHLQSLSKTGWNRVIGSTFGVSTYT